MAITDQLAPQNLSRAWRLPGAAVILPLITIAIAIAEPRFLTGSNLSNVGLQGALLLMIALPMTLVILTEGLDLSAGALLSLASVVLGTALVAGWSLAAATAVTLGVGALTGLANGILIGRFGMPTFVVTLGTMGICHGAALVLTGGNVVSGFDSGLSTFYRMQLLGLPVPVLAAAAAYAAFHLLLYRTAFGSYIFAIGGNKEALRLAGVRADVVHVVVYILASATVAASSLLLVGRMNAAHPTVTLGMEFDAIAAVVLGGTSFERGRGWLFGAVLGVAVIAILRNGLSLLAIDSSLQVAAVGVLVIVALLFNKLTRAD